MHHRAGVLGQRDVVAALLHAGFRLVARGDLETDNPSDDPLHEILRLDRPEP